MTAALPLNRDALRPTLEVVACAGPVDRTLVPLGIGLAYTSAWLDVADYEQLRLRSLANQASAAGGVQLDWSLDGATVATSEVLGTALAATFYDSGFIPRRCNWVRVYYINGAAAQGTFRCELSAYP